MTSNDCCSTKGTVFFFNGCYYRQKDGVAMGSPLGPALANAFLAHHETVWLEECPLSFAPIFFARYVDDIYPKSTVKLFVLNTFSKSIAYGMQMDHLTSLKIRFLEVSAKFLTAFDGIW